MLEFDSHFDCEWGDLDEMPICEVCGVGDYVTPDEDGFTCDDCKYELLKPICSNCGEREETALMATESMCLDCHAELQGSHG